MAGPGQQLGLGGTLSPAYYLVLRDAKGAIAYGTQAIQKRPSFSAQMPTNVDWSTALISVVQGRPTLGTGSGATLSCQDQ